jgi:hypothetical protein
MIGLLKKGLQRVSMKLPICEGQFPVTSMMLRFGVASGLSNSTAILGNHISRHTVRHSLSRAKMVEGVLVK